MSTYQRLPTDDAEPSRAAAPVPEVNDHADMATHEASADADRPLRQSVQEEFDRPAPATWKRVLLIVAIIVMGWISIRLGSTAWAGKKQPQIIYATRYSDEFKYRPAASPVITEYLKDGRIRLRGASVGGVGVPEADIPKSPAQIELEKAKRVEEARAAAKAQLKEAKAAREARRRAKNGNSNSGGTATKKRKGGGAAGKKARRAKTEI